MDGILTLHSTAQVALVLVLSALLWLKLIVIDYRLRHHR